MIKTQSMRIPSVEGLKKKLDTIPSGLKKFIVRGAILFIVWRLLYEFVLQPAGMPDKQLIELIMWGTHKMLAPFYSNLTSDGYNLFIDNKLAITIATPCNGLELMVLYVGFLVCLPTTFKRFLAFATVGVTLTILLNMVRCAALAILFQHNYELADFMHHYLFKLAIYGVNFYLWILYSKKDGVLKA